MLKAITALLVLLGGIWKFFTDSFSAKSKARKEAVEDGKKAVDEHNATGITRAFDKLRRK